MNNRTYPASAKVRELFTVLGSRLNKNVSIRHFRELLSPEETILILRWQQDSRRRHQSQRRKVDVPFATKVCNTMKVCNVEGSNNGPRPRSEERRVGKEC